LNENKNITETGQLPNIKKEENYSLAPQFGQNLTPA
jgi:hypothetical protein